MIVSDNKRRKLTLTHEYESTCVSRKQETEFSLSQKAFHRHSKINPKKRKSKRKSCYCDHQSRDFRGQQLLSEAFEKIDQLLKENPQKCGAVHSSAKQQGAMLQIHMLIRAVLRDIVEITQKKKLALSKAQVRVLDTAFVQSSGMSRKIVK